MNIIPEIKRVCNRFVSLVAPTTSVEWRKRYRLGTCLQSETEIPDWVRLCPIATRLRRLLAPLDWDGVPERPLLRRNTGTPYPGPTPEARAPYLFFFLVGLTERCQSHALLARFLADHPSLLWLAGIGLTADHRFRYGFDPQRTAPTRDRLRTVLRDLDPTALDWLLYASVHLFERVPDFGQTVAGDTKHILAWVKENNPKCYVEHRFDKNRQPPGDPDCKLGVKSRCNLPPTPTAAPLPSSSVPKSVADHLYWGYASGVVVTPLSQGMGQVVLAEETRPFDQSDIAYFQPLMDKTVAALGFHPRFGAWDAAFDAFYVYDAFHAAGGFAAVPLNLHGKPTPRHTPQGIPLCPTDLPMHPDFTYTDRSGLVAQTKQRYACPLLQPDPTGDRCSHPMFAKGGCTANRGTSPGALIRYTLNRDGPTYKRIYDQRSAVERLNSQAVALGIERPRLRNLRSIRNRNTLIYILLNLQTFQRLLGRAPNLLNSS